MYWKKILSRGKQMKGIRHLWLQKQCKYRDKLLFRQFSCVTAEAASATAISKPDPHENKDKRALGSEAEVEWQSDLGSWLLPFVIHYHFARVETQNPTV